MTEKQKRFCDEYLIDLNATQAALRAGYSPKTAHSTGSENMRKPEISNYLKNRLAEKQSELIAQQDEVLETLTRVLRREEDEVVVVTCKEKHIDYDDQGRKSTTEQEVPKRVPIPTKVADLNKAAELLGKRYGLYTDKLDIGADAKLDITIDYGDGPE